MKKGIMNTFLRKKLLRIHNGSPEMPSMRVHLGLFRPAHKSQLSGMPPHPLPPFTVRRNCGRIPKTDKGRMQAAVRPGQIGPFRSDRFIRFSKYLFPFFETRRLGSWASRFLSICFLVVPVLLLVFLITCVYRFFFAIMPIEGIKLYKFSPLHSHNWR